MDEAKDLASQTAQVVVGSVVQGSLDISGTSLISMAVDVVGLAWKAGAYLHHRRTFQQSLAACLDEYVEAGYLTTVTSSPKSKGAGWQTTPAFRDAKMLHHLYPDIEHYLAHHAFTSAELEALGLNSTITIHADKPKGLENITIRLSAACQSDGIKDITKTDAEKRINNVSFMHTGAVVLQNAFIAEGQRRERGEKPSVVPVLARVIGIVALCGMTEIGVSEVSKLDRPTSTSRRSACDSDSTWKGANVRDSRPCSCSKRSTTSCKPCIQHIAVQWQYGERRQRLWIDGFKV